MKKSAEKKPVFIVAEQPYSGNPILMDFEVIDRSFATVEEARKFIHTDATNHINAVDVENHGNNETYCNRYVILQVMEVIRPVPVVNWTIKMETL